MVYNLIVAMNNVSHISNGVCAFCIIFFGYMLQTATLQYLYYYCKTKDIQWKIQQNRKESIGSFWGLPLFSVKPNRGDYHAIFTSFNLFIASTFAAVTAECSVGRLNYMRFGDLTAQEPRRIAVEVLAAIMYQSVAEYYWHRLMHTKYFYKVFHKYHHFYKSPEPWDDMYIHPAEAAGYYCILYGPPFLFPLHWASFVAYMVVMGLCGVLDHSGVRLCVPGVYNTVDHDTHHLKFDVNYSFPFPYMDILHGTFDGELLGVRYHCAKRGSASAEYSKLATS